MINGINLGKDFLTTNSNINIIQNTNLGELQMLGMSATIYFNHEMMLQTRISVLKKICLKEEMINRPLLTHGNPPRPSIMDMGIQKLPQQLNLNKITTFMIGNPLTNMIGVDMSVVNLMKIADIIRILINEEITNKIIELAANLLVKKTDIKKVVVDCLRTKEVMFKNFKEVH